MLLLWKSYNCQKRLKLSICWGLLEPSIYLLEVELSRVTAIPIYLTHNVIYDEEKMKKMMIFPANFFVNPSLSIPVLLCRDGVEMPVRYQHIELL